jgi:hypothetical protein
VGSRRRKSSWIQSKAFQKAGSLRQTPQRGIPEGGLAPANAPARRQRVQIFRSGDGGQRADERVDLRHVHVEEEVRIAPERTGDDRDRVLLGHQPLVLAEHGSHVGVGTVVGQRIDHRLVARAHVTPSETVAAAIRPT